VRLASFSSDLTVRRLGQKFFKDRGRPLSSPGPLGRAKSEPVPATVHNCPSSCDGFYVSNAAEVVTPSKYDFTTANLRQWSRSEI
jgi:hypothetical protein